MQADNFVADTGFNLGQEAVALSYTRGHSSWILGRIFLRRSGEVVERAAQGAGGVTVPGGVI